MVTTLKPVLSQQEADELISDAYAAIEVAKRYEESPITEENNCIGLLDMYLDELAAVLQIGDHGRFHALRRTKFDIARHYTRQYLLVNESTPSPYVNDANPRHYDKARYDELFHETLARVDYQ